MSMDKPFRVEVEVDAPRDVVWRELTEPERIRHWFGWEYDGLDDEIKFIFVDHAKPVPPDRIELVQDGTTELIERGDKTLIRVIKPGDLDAAEWQDVYGDIEEGWITFFNQLRYRLAVGGGERRMLVRTGSAIPSSARPGGFAVVREPLPARRDVDGELVVVFAKPEGEASLVVTTYDLDDEAFAEAEQRWTAWWESVSS